MRSSRGILITTVELDRLAVQHIIIDYLLGYARKFPRCPSRSGCGMWQHRGRRDAHSEGWASGSPVGALISVTEARF
jgi:hypothetical protein